MHLVGAVTHDRTLADLGPLAALHARTLEEELGDLRVTALEVRLRTDGGMVPPPETALYHWAEGTWLALDDPVVGSNLLGDVEGLVSPDGLVHVRLSSERGGSGGCFYVDLGLEGMR